ncbi:hypothetical protein J6Y50_07090 [bacterium]|nr:hypothetical protein [bacterium]
MIDKTEYEYIENISFFSRISRFLKKHYTPILLILVWLFFTLLWYFDPRNNDLEMSYPYSAVIQVVIGCDIILLFVIAIIRTLVTVVKTIRKRKNKYSESEASITETVEPESERFKRVRRDPIDREPNRAKRIMLRTLRGLKSHYKLKLWILASLILDAAGYFYMDEPFASDAPRVLAFITFMMVAILPCMFITAIILSPVVLITILFDTLPVAVENVTNKILDFLK